MKMNGKAIYFSPRSLFWMTHSPIENRTPFIAYVLLRAIGLYPLHEETRRLKRVSFLNTIVASQKVSECQPEDLTSRCNIQM